MGEMCENNNQAESSWYQAYKLKQYGLMFKLYSVLAVGVAIGILLTATAKLEWILILLLCVTIAGILYDFRKNINKLER